MGQSVKKFGFNLDREEDNQATASQLLELKLTTLFPGIMYFVLKRPEIHLLFTDRLRRVSCSSVKLFNHSQIN